MRELRVGEFVKFKCRAYNKICIGKVTEKDPTYLGHILTVILPGCGGMLRGNVCSISDKEKSLLLTKEDRINILKYMLIGKR